MDSRSPTSCRKDIQIQMTNCITLACTSNSVFWYELEEEHFVLSLLFAKYIHNSVIVYAVGMASFIAEKY